MSPGANTNWRHGLRRRSFLTCVLAVGASAAGAQETQRATPTSPEEHAGLAEVRVTAARRREERLLDVPDSLTVLNHSTLERTRVQSVKDVAPLVPNFSIVDAQQPGVAHITLRGVGQSRTSESPVAVVIDGVQVSDSYQVTQYLFDIERIEVLKGPQGAVYGRNALGGAIDITTRAPTSELEGSMRIGMGSNSDYSAGGVISGALVPDALLFRMSAHGRSFGGNVSSPNTPGRENANELDDRGARLSLIATPSDIASFDLRLSHNFTESGAPWYAVVPPGAEPDAPRVFAGNFPSNATRSLTDAALKTTLQFERAQLASVTAFSKVRTVLDSDGDFTAVDGVFGDQKLAAEHWSQELRLTSRADTAFKWLAGVYYLNTHQLLDTQIFVGRDFLPAFGLPPELAPLRIASTRTVDSNDAYAGFGQASYRWPANIELTLALRYDEDRRHQLDRGAPAPQVYDATFDAWQPKVSLSWFATPTRMIYATAGKGFRSGGFNPQDRITRIYRAETNVSEEIGTKLSMLGNRVNVTAALFHTRIEDRQVYTLDVLNSAQTLSNPIPVSSVRGAELELSARPMPAFEISASVGAARSRIERYDPSVFAGLPVAGDFTGNKLPQTPELSWALQSQYRVAFERGIALIPRVEWLGQAGDYFWEIDNANRRRAQSLLNVRLILERAAWTVNAYLENATNEQYVLEFLPTRWSGFPADVSAAARGRHGGIEATWRF